MPTFYSAKEYKQKQSQITIENWKRGVYDFRRNLREKRVCKNPECKNIYLAKHSELKQFCSRHCSGLIKNQNRTLSTETKQKIAFALKNLPKELRGKHFTKPKVELTCKGCKIKFKVVPYLSVTRKYCSIKCAEHALGKQTTSPKASKGKNGIRTDISKTINFYSTWEANIARVYNLVGIRWKYAPKLFDLGKHTYRPDFYLTKFKSYVEVKNFMSDYSKERDYLFREKYPNINLDLILKNEYLEIKTNYKDLVEQWES